jgi:hypothetical protein
MPRSTSGHGSHRYQFDGPGAVTSQNYYINLCFLSISLHVFTGPAGARSQYGAMHGGHKPQCRSLLGLVRQTPRGARISIRGRICRSAFKTCQRTEYYFRQFLRVLAPILRSPELGPVLFRDDNQAVIKLTVAPDIPKRSRHIDVKYHLICAPPAWQKLVISSSCTSRPM